MVFTDSLLGCFSKSNPVTFQLKQKNRIRKTIGSELQSVRDCV